MSESINKFIRETMPVITDTQSIFRPDTKERRKPSRTFMVKYGPILIRKRDATAPTLATGRRPKDAVVEGEDLAKMEIRRMKNRLAARNLKKLRDNIEHDLQEQVKELELQEQNLLTKIDTLETHRNQLQQQYVQPDRADENMTQAAADTLAEFKRKKTLRHLAQIEPKEEIRSPSPEWQLSFHI